jgi:electron transport complex protein RnfB
VRLSESKQVITMGSDQKKIGRRGFVADGLRILGAVGLGGAACALAARNGLYHGEVWRSGVWQLDPDKCMACGNCQTHCVLDQSAVKAVNCFALCGYCDVCTGYFPTKDFVLDTGAENQLCPTGAITRKFVEAKSGERFFEYTIDETLCIACGKCVVGCKLMNGSLYLQVRHDRCLHCNECSIAIACPTQAFSRLPADSPGLLKKAAREAEAALARKRERGHARFSPRKGTVPFSSDENRDSPQAAPGATAGLPSSASHTAGRVSSGTHVFPSALPPGAEQA